MDVSKIWMFSISSISSILNISGLLGTQTLSHSHFEREVPGKKTRAVTFMLLFADILLCGGEFAGDGSLHELERNHDLVGGSHEI